MIKVLKASGEYQAFDEGKVRSSLKRAGADSQLINKIISDLKGRLYDGIPTAKIYDYVFSQLRKIKSPVSSKYNLKKAIMELGPSGYPFEKFMAGVLKIYGYQTSVNEIVKGKCVKHEIDIWLTKDDQQFACECKFHNRPGIKTEVKTALYVYARFLDIKEIFSQAWLITNTKLTRRAEKYGCCVGLRMISWDYPTDFSLRFLIEKSRLHPITCLNSLSSAIKEQLLNQDIVFCHQLLAKKLPPVLSTNNLREVKAEAKSIYSLEKLR